MLVWSLAQPVAAQVVSIQPTAGLGGSSFAASSRLQYGASVPPNYQGAVVGNLGLPAGLSAQITSALSAAIIAQGGLEVGTSPTVWNSLTGTATFSVQFIQAGPPGEGVLIVTVNGPGFAAPVVLADNVNFSGAQGVNLNFLGGGGAFYGGLVLTSGAVPPVSLGPSGNWSGTSLSNSTLTGWDFTQNWTLDGSMRFFPGTGSDQPRLQFDILNQGLAYQLSDQGTGRPGIVNYGRTNDLVITAAEFQQAQFGGTNGIVEADIFSREQVEFAIGAGNTVELTGGLFDLTSVVSFVNPADFGTAEFIKSGAGTLILSGTSSYSGKTILNGGTTVLRNASGLGRGGLDIGNATLTLESDPDLGPGAPLNVLGAATIDSTSRRTLDVRSVITGAAPTSLTLRNVDVDFSGDATNFLGDLIADDASFTMVDITLGGSASAVNGSIFDGTGQINGDLSIADSRLLLTGGDATVPGTLDVLGNLSLDASSTMVANVFLPLVGGAGTIRQSDRVNVTGSAAMDGSLIALYNRDNSVGRLIPLPGQARTWQIIDSSAGNTGTGTFSAAQLVISSPSAGTSTVLDLPVNGEVSTALVKITTSFGPAGASITLLGLAALPPDAVVDTECGTYTGSQVNQIVDELILTETNGTADASAVAGAILLYFDFEDMPPAYYATQQRNPYADPDVILDSAAMAGRVAMLRLMQLRDGGIGNAAAKAADASGGRAPDVAAQSQFGAPLNGPTPDEDARVWLRGYGFYEQVDGSDCVGCGYDASIGAAMVGADWATDGGGIVGVFAGLGPGSINYDAFFGTQNEDVQQAMAGLYGSLVPGDGAMYLEGYALGGYYDIDRTRTVSIPNVANRVATSDNSAWGLSVGGELGLNLPLGDDTWLQPFGGVTWGQYWGDGYNEQGADSLNLRVGDQSANEWMPTAGARIMHTSRNGRDVLTPFVGAAFLAQLPVGAGWAPTYTSDFNLGVPTQYDEGPIDRYGATVQAGLEFAMGSRATAYIAFDGAWLTGKQRYGGQVGIFVPF